jgi:HPr kinase/phosphorylase
MLDSKSLQRRTRVRYRVRRGSASDAIVGPVFRPEDALAEDDGIASIAAGTVHAGCIVLGEAGVLIRGASGAGKSTLARELVRQAGQAGLFASLVSDDRTRIAAVNGRLVARPMTAIAGYAEIRGVGIVRGGFEPAAVVRLVIDLSEDQPLRHPEAAESQIALCGILLCRIRARTGAPLLDLALGSLSGAYDAVVTL